MQIQIIPALADNYIFILLDDSELEAAAVDPGDATPVLQFLTKTKRTLTAILNTHHHHDHTGGNAALLRYCL
jgi:hydroxyacylglutathione hydrolase